MLACYADLHIHIGQSLDGKAVKITAAKSLNLPGVIEVARDLKGLAMIGIIDAQSPGVRQDFSALLQEGALRPLEGGGYTARGLIIIPGTEIELSLGTGAAHFLAYFPTLGHLEKYIRKLRPYVKNWQLSSQKVHLGVEQWLEAVALGEGLWLPAHAFTPHKGIYGNCCARLLDVLPEMPLALEIGLSADRQMARSLRELNKVALFSNSDAHSLPNIAREYNLLSLAEGSFQGLRELVQRIKGEVSVNYGLPPVFGKYHRTFCLVCAKVAEGAPPLSACPICGGRQVVMGVLDRLVGIADAEITGEADPRYIYQLPLKDLPGIGPQLIRRLLRHFGTEMNVLHQVSREDLAKIAGEKAARWIDLSRQGKLLFQAGGGGVFGKVVDILAPLSE